MRLGPKVSSITLLSFLGFSFSSQLWFFWGTEFKLYTWSGKCQSTNYFKAPCLVVSIYTSQKQHACIRIVSASCANILLISVLWCHKGLLPLIRILMQSEQLCWALLRVITQGSSLLMSCEATMVNTQPPGLPQKGKRVCRRSLRVLYGQFYRTPITCLHTPLTRTQWEERERWSSYVPRKRAWGGLSNYTTSTNTRHRLWPHVNAWLIWHVILILTDVWQHGHQTFRLLTDSGIHLTQPETAFAASDSLPSLCAHSWVVISNH